jgi:hypothetical protein
MQLLSLLSSSFFRIHRKKLILSMVVIEVFSSPGSALGKSTCVSTKVELTKVRWKETRNTIKSSTVARFEFSENIIKYIILFFQNNSSPLGKKEGSRVENFQLVLCVCSQWQEETYLFPLRANCF